MMPMAVAGSWLNTPSSRYVSTRRPTSAAVKPTISLKSGSRLMLVPMLKPLVTSSMVIGDTPVMNRRSTPPPLRSAPDFRVAKKLR